MKKQIEIIIKGQSYETVTGILLDFFRLDRSPILPVYVTFDASLHDIGKSGDPNLGTPVFRNFRVAKWIEPPIRAAHVLAQIHISAYPSHVLLTMEEIESPENWEPVKALAREVILRMQQFQFQIVSVEPQDQLPKPSLPPWKHVKDYGADQKIVELWHEGLTYAEIGRKVSRAPGTVVNRLGALRRQHGDVIVPLRRPRQAKRPAKKRGDFVI